MVSLTFSVVFLVGLCSASLVLAAPIGKCSLNKDQCSIECPESTSLDLSALTNEYKIFKSSQKSTGNNLQFMFDCDGQQSFLAWSLAVVDSAPALQVAFKVPLNLGYSNVILKCHSEFAIHSDADTLFVDSPQLCSVLHGSSLIDFREHVADDFQASRGPSSVASMVAQQRQKIELDEPVQDIYLFGSTLYSVGHSEISVHAIRDEKAAIVSYEVPKRHSLTSYSKIAVDKEKIVVTGKDSVHTTFLNSFNFDDVWTQSTTLEGPQDSWFGYAVAVSGDTLMVSQIDTGEVFVYTMKSSTGHWILTQIIAGPQDESIGYALAMDGDLALVGSPKMNVVYCYQRHSDGSWFYQSAINSPYTNKKWFGQFISLSGHIAVISDDNSVHLYKWDTTDGWQYQSDIPGLVSGVSSLSVSGDVLMVLTSPTTIEVFTLPGATATATATAAAASAAVVSSTSAKAGSSHLRIAASSHFPPLLTGVGDFADALFIQSLSCAFVYWPLFVIFCTLYCGIRSAVLMTGKPKLLVLPLSSSLESADLVKCSVTGTSPPLDDLLLV